MDKEFRDAMYELLLKVPPSYSMEKADHVGEQTRYGVEIQGPWGGESFYSANSLCKYLITLIIAKGIAENITFKEAKNILDKMVDLLTGMEDPE